MNEGPRQSGSVTAYLAEYKTEDGIWKPIPIRKFPDGSGIGVPTDRFHGKLFEQLDLMGYEQAMTLCWWAKASKVFIETRLVPYDFTYSLESTRKEDQALLIKRIPMPEKEETNESTL